MSKMKRLIVPAAWMDQWTARLATAIAMNVREYHSRLVDVPVAAFHVGCYPWHGGIDLSLLTVKELSADPLLLSPAEVAAWQHYDFAAGIDTWETAVELGRQMKDAYYAATEDERPAMVEEFLRACAVAVASLEITSALASLNRSTDFKISVTHPDSDHEFYPPKHTVRE